MSIEIGKGLKREFPRKFLSEKFNPENPSEVASYFDKLDAEVLSSIEALDSLLLEWSELDAAVGETGAVLHIKMVSSTDDESVEKRYFDYEENVLTLVKSRSDSLIKKFLASPFVKNLPRDRYLVLVRQFETDAKLFREENIPLEIEETKLIQNYMKTMGAMTVNYDGRERTLQEMAKYLEEQDASVRQEAWRKMVERRLKDKDAIDGIFDRMLTVRTKMAANAGFPNYREFIFLQKQRFDYGVAECEAFHDAVEKCAAPLNREIQERRRKRMNVEKLRPWDLKQDPLGRPALKPFSDAAQLAEGCREIFGRIDPELGDRFKFMIDRELLDLKSRKGKAPGAFSHTLDELRFPFIFSNAVGVDGDLNTLLHEAGHAFHTFESRREPLSFYRDAPLEFAEVASMSMEFLGGDHLRVFYSEKDAARSIETHLESVINLFCWIAVVDGFQHWIYTHPDHTREERADAWMKIKDRFAGIEDWTGYENARRHEWHRQLHIFASPFYYIEYGIAQLGALQIWIKYGLNKKEALNDYKKALALGGSKPLPDLFSAAGIKFDMSVAAVKPLVDKIAEALEQISKIAS